MMCGVSAPPYNPLFAWLASQALGFAYTITFLCWTAFFNVLAFWLPVPIKPNPRPVELLLPPPLHPGRLCIVLDLDETLIASWAPSELPASLRCADCPLACTLMRLPHGPGISDASTQRLSRSQIKGTGHLAPHQQGSQTGSGLRYGQVLVVQRPGLHSFLKRLSTFAELVLFTAAVPEYAEPVVRQVLDPDGSLFQGRLLYRQHTRIRHLPPDSGNHASPQCIKDLAGLGRDLSRVVLVDNNPFSFLHQPSNGIPCLPFRSDPSDRHLSAVLLPLLQSLALFADVRPILDARFRLGDWFAQRGFIPPQPAGMLPAPLSHARANPSVTVSQGREGCSVERSGVSSVTASEASSDAESYTQDSQEGVRHRHAGYKGHAAHTLYAKHHGHVAH